MYMKQIDCYNGQLYISCLMTAAGSRFLLLHEARANEDPIKSFFNGAYELYVKITMNPFFDDTQAIKVPAFETQMSELASSCMCRPKR